MDGSGCLSLCVCGGGCTEPLSLSSLFSSRWCCGSLGLQLQVGGTAPGRRGSALAAGRVGPPLAHLMRHPVPPQTLSGTGGRRGSPPCQDPGQGRRPRGLGRMACDAQRWPQRRPPPSQPLLCVFQAAPLFSGQAAPEAVPAGPAGWVEEQVAGGSALFLAALSFSAFLLSPAPAGLNAISSSRLHETASAW